MNLRLNQLRTHRIQGEARSPAENFEIARTIGGHPKTSPGGAGPVAYQLDEIGTVFRARVEEANFVPDRAVIVFYADGSRWDAIVPYLGGYHSPWDTTPMSREFMAKLEALA